MSLSSSLSMCLRLRLLSWLLLVLLLLCLPSPWHATSEILIIVDSKLVWIKVREGFRHLLHRFIIKYRSQIQWSEEIIEDLLTFLVWMLYWLLYLFFHFIKIISDIHCIHATTKEVSHEVTSSGIWITSSLLVPWLMVLKHPRDILILLLLTLLLLLKLMILLYLWRTMI